MAVIKKFSGKRVEIPDDRRYSNKQGLWAKPEGQEIVFGFSEPALILVGGLNDLEWLVKPGDPVQKGDTVVFAITGKIQYIDSPIGGDIQFNPEIKDTPAIVSEDPYNRGWLFKIKPGGDPEKELNSLATDLEYAESLKTTEGAKNLEGLKGGVSGICKAVYSSIQGQKL